MLGCAQTHLFRSRDEEALSHQGGMRHSHLMTGSWTVEKKRGLVLLGSLVPQSSAGTNGNTRPGRSYCTAQEKQDIHIENTEKASRSMSRVHSSQSDFCGVVASRCAAQVDLWHAAWMVYQASPRCKCFSTTLSIVPR